jgi:hypothetical protein
VTTTPGRDTLTPDCLFLHLYRPPLSPSKTQVQAELDLPWREHVGRNLSDPGNTDRSVGRPIVLNVENVKEFRPEGNEKLLTNGEILEYRTIRVIHGRRPQDVSSKVSVGIYWYGERIRVEPLIYGRVCGVWISYDVRPGVVPKRESVADIGYVAYYRQVVRLAGT